MRLVDMTGLRFSRLTVVAREGSRCEKPMWRCACDCGASLLVFGDNLRKGATMSCGCLRREKASALGSASKGGPGPIRHGESRGSGRTPEYVAWRAMRQRCNGTIDRELYFDRGIRCCERWDSYENFLADMGRKPSPKHSIDRIDNDRGYEPGNCRWATAKEQANNRRPRRDRRAA